MNRSWMCNAAVVSAILFTAMLAGPGLVGAAVASADLLGIDIDIPIIGDDDDRDDPGPPVGLPSGARGDGADESSGNSAIHRSSKLPPVPTEPQSQTITIRKPPTAAESPSVPAAPSGPAPAPVPSGPAIAIAPPVTLPPITLPPVAVPAAPVAPAAPAAPAPPAAPVISPPPPPDAPAPAGPLNSRTVPEARPGYADYLQNATVASLLAIVIPGTAGLAAVAGVGGFVGYRQAMAQQTLPPTNISRFTK